MVALTYLDVHQAATSLLDCVCEALDRVPVAMPGLAGCPCRVGVVPGAPAADGCDGGCNVPPGEWPGQLTVNVVRTYPAELPRWTNVAAVQAEATNCGPAALLAVELAVTLWRCTPVSSDDGCPPPMDALSENAMQLHVDMLAINQGVTCCFPTAGTSRRKGRRYSLGASAVLGPQGGCIGVQTPVTVLLDGLSVPVLEGP